MSLQVQSFRCSWSVILFLSTADRSHPSSDADSCTDSTSSSCSTETECQCPYCSDPSAPYHPLEEIRGVGVRYVQGHVKKVYFRHIQSS